MPAAGRVKRVPAALVLAGAIVWGLPAAAAPPPDGRAELPARQVRQWVATCHTCHGQAGPATAVPPGLAPAQVPQPLEGRPAAELLQALQQLQAAAVPGATVMHQLAAGYSAAQLQRIAQALAAGAPAARGAAR